MLQSSCSEILVVFHMDDPHQVAAMVNKVVEQYNLPGGRPLNARDIMYILMEYDDWGLSNDKLRNPNTPMPGISITTSEHGLCVMCGDYDRDEFPALLAFSEYLGREVHAYDGGHISTYYNWLGGIDDDEGDEGE